MRPVHAWPLLLVVAACSASPPPSAPADPAPVVAPAPPPTAAPVASATKPPAADEGAPPDPPMAMRWTFDLPSFDGQPWRRERLALAESGDATWESARGEGDGDIDEELSPAKDTAVKREQCRGHLGPALHRRLVLAAQKAMASGCAQKAAATDRLGRRAEVATTTIAVTWEGEIKTCALGRSGGSYAAFEQVRSEVVGAICARR